MIIQTGLVFKFDVSNFMKSELACLTLLTSQFLGADSKLYPFANMTFADMVNTYLPIFTQLNNKNPIKTMFRTGFYANLVNAEREVYL